jgi:hypothetical protein
MKSINVSEECYNKLREEFSQNDVIEIEDYKGLVGKKLFMRTVTYHMVGRVEGIMGSFLKLKDASWIADSGRFMNAIKEGKLNEVEPVGIAFVNIESVVDMFPWEHDLPKAQK